MLPWANDNKWSPWCAWSQISKGWPHPKIKHSHRSQNIIHGVLSPGGFQQRVNDKGRSLRVPLLLFLQFVDFLFWWLDLGRNMCNIYIIYIYIIISFPTISLLPFFVIESMSEFLNGPSQFHQFLPLENYHQSWKCETEPSNETVFLFQPIKWHQKILRIQSDICKAFGHRRKPPPGTCKAPRLTHVCNVSLICLPGLCTTMTEKIVKTNH
jgi:hypothetical protein